MGISNFIETLNNAKFLSIDSIERKIKIAKIFMDDDNESDENKIILECFISDLENILKTKIENTEIS